MLTSPTDVGRWERNANAEPVWVDRNRALARWIAAPSSVLDVGAGSMSLRAFLPGGCQYTPIDVVRSSPETRVVDFNAWTTPLFAQPFDYVVASGVLEYVVDPQFFLRTVAGWGRRVILSYATAREQPDVDARRRSGWVNDLTADALEQLIAACGLRVAARDAWQAQHLYLLAPERTAAPVAAPRWPVSLFRADRTNVGDWHSAPARYLPALAGAEIDVFNVEHETRIDAPVVIGGGGLFHPVFEERFGRVRFSPRHPVVGWGLGENTRIDQARGWVDEGPLVLPSWIERCDLLGVRDDGHAARWVPCASCLHPSFGVDRVPSHDVVVFSHKRVPIDAAGLQTMTNDGDDLETVLDFLGSAHVVVTNSYHGAYWATLLGRAVVALPFSSKFWGLRHRPVLCKPEGWRRGVEFARAYPDALRECRQANLAFAADALPLIASGLRADGANGPSPRRLRSAAATDDAHVRVTAEWLRDREPIFELRDRATLPPKNTLWRGIVVAAGVIPPASIASRLAPGGRLVLESADDPRLDRLKARLQEHAHVGPGETGGPSLWCGGTMAPRPMTAGGALPCVVSYYTTGTPYEDEAAALAGSCRAAGVPHDIRPAPPRGTWEANCAYKATFIREVWRERQAPVLWVDADARVLRSPELLRGTAADFAVHKVARWQFASGTIFFNHTAMAARLLETWERLCRQHPHVLDQLLLDAAWEEVASRHPLHTLWLPPAYTSIVDHPEALADPNPPVIVHLQASRRFKAAVSTAAVPRAVPAVPAAWRRARSASRVWTDAGGGPKTDAAVSDPDFVPVPGTPAAIPGDFLRYERRVAGALKARGAGRIAIFGASWFGARLASRMRRAGSAPVRFFDNASRAQDTTLQGYPIVACDTAGLDTIDTVVIASIQHGRALSDQVRAAAGPRAIRIVAPDVIRR